MKNTRYAYIASMALLFASCGQEDGPASYDTDESTVSFIVSMPTVSSRAAIYYDDLKSLFNNGDDILVTSFVPEGESVGNLEPFAKDFLITKRQDGAYRNDDCRWPQNRGPRDGKMKFFAHYPTCEQLCDYYGVPDTFFVLKNYSRITPAGNAEYDYRIENFKIDNDISKHMDFVAVGVEGCKTENIYSGVRLNFEHQLSCVDFLAWNSENEYNVEIAAVKICNVMTRGDFCFNRAPYAEKGDNATGHWEYPQKYKKDTVEYIYKEGEKLFVIDGNNHATKQTAGSIFGTAGNALLLPCGHKKWEHGKDPTNKAGGLYITALIRVEKRSTGVQIYPEPGHRYGSGGVHYYLINKQDSTINTKELKLYVKHLSAGDNQEIEVGADDKPVYYTDKGCTKIYTAPTGCEVKELAWAAIPLEVNWKPGYRYTYYLDYGKGVGVYDPTDIGNNVAPNVMIIGFDAWISDYKVTLTVG